jgi:hypothetical protein
LQAPDLGAGAVSQDGVDHLQVRVPPGDHLQSIVTLLTNPESHLAKHGHSDCLSTLARWHQGPKS